MAIVRITNPGKSIRLIAIYIIFLWMLYLAPGYHNWFRGITIQYQNMFDKEVGRQDVGYRELYRTGQIYLMARYFQTIPSKNPDVKLLLPPASYFNHFGISPLWAEPKVWFYYVGKMPTYAWDHPDRSLATHTILFDDKNEPHVVKIIAEHMDVLLEDFQHPQPIPSGS
ncbi:MAG: hypothetical protein KDD36_07770 [Flavobacteriales bacterium]|nr:hypothetical protein [Flavobacteriales bacterium]